MVGGRGLQRATWFLGRLFPAHHGMRVRIGNRGLLDVPMWDGYWVSVALCGNYEREILVTLDRLLGPAVAFIDCGANIGYWSIWASEHAAKAVAVEASPDTFMRLIHSAALNEKRFAILHRAVWETDGQTITILTHPLRHAGDSVVDQRGAGKRHSYRRSIVETITLATLYDRFVGTGPAIVKLDVEGAELEALESAWALFHDAPLACIYEDHGNDAGCRVTKRVLAQGMAVWLLDEDRPLRISSVAQLELFKTDPTYGYNLLATSPASVFARQMCEAERLDSKGAKELNGDSFSKGLTRPPWG